MRWSAMLVCLLFFATPAANADPFQRRPSSPQQAPEKSFFDRDFATEGYFPSDKEEKTKPSTQPQPSPSPPSSDPPMEEPSEKKRNVMIPNIQNQEISSFFEKPPTRADEEVTVAEIPYSTYKLSTLPLATSGATISLVVNAENSLHLYNTLRTLHRFRSEYPVKLGEILLVGGTGEVQFFDAVRPAVFGPTWKDEFIESLRSREFPEEQLTEQLRAAEKLVNPTVRTVLELGVSSARFIPADDALDRLKVTTSPAWIIRVDGEDHIFEGSYDLVKLFDKEGNFLLSGEGEAVPKKQTTSSDGPGLLTQHSVPLKRHSVKNGIPFNIPYNIPFRIPGRSFIMEDTAPPRRLSPNDTTAVNEALPACRESVVRRNPVGSASPMTLVLDALFYDAENKQHGERTKRVTTNPVPYKNGQRINEADPNESPWQLFAPLFGVRCLPTRFHFIKEKGVGYMEYREGEEAFTETKSEFDLTL